MSKFVAWIDQRLPVSKFVKNHLSEYYAPKNFNFFYFFGSLALFVFILQIITGIFLTINYKPDEVISQLYLHVFHELKR